MLCVCVILPPSNLCALLSAVLLVPISQLGRQQMSRVRRPVSQQRWGEHSVGCQLWSSIPRTRQADIGAQQKLLNRSDCFLMCRGSCHPLIEKKIPLIKSLKRKLVFQKKSLSASYRELGKDSLLIPCPQILIIDWLCSHYFRQFIQLNCLRSHREWRL